VWRVRADDGVFALKSLTVTALRVAFLTEAHAYLNERSTLAPVLRPTTSGALYVEDGSTSYVLMDWLEASDEHVSLSDPDQLAAVAGTMADFHLASSGFRPSVGTDPRDYLGTWPDVYQARIRLLTVLKQDARRGLRGRADDAYLSAVNSILDQADLASQLLERAPYKSWCELSRQRGGFVHQDFAKGNLLLTEDGLKVCDLDAIAIDIPARDLRNLLTRAFREARACRPELVDAALAAYRAKAPLTSGQLEVLMADLLFPHHFVRAARDLYMGLHPDRTPAQAAPRLQFLASLEESKRATLVSGAGEVFV